MRIVFLVSSGPHAHDYGLDFLFQGFVEILGTDNVIDWPVKPCLHLVPGQSRDVCQIDSDAWLPRWDWNISGGGSAEQALDGADAVFLAMSLEDHEGCVHAHHVVHNHVPRGTLLVALDMGDQVRDRRGEYESRMGHPVDAYFKRELPLGATWGHPCPLSYPKCRVPDELPRKLPRLVYHATHHGDMAPGVPRKIIINGVRKLVPPSKLDIGLYPTQQNRPLPEQYHDRLARGLVGISWNGAPNWDCNRYWESLAYGLCLIAERPRIQIPNPPEHLKHVYYVDRPEQVAPIAALMLGQQSLWPLSIAAAGREHWRKFHTSEARARYILDTLGLN